MNTKIDNLAGLIGVIESAGVPALRVAFTIAAGVFVAAGFFIFRKRHQLFDADPEVVDDTPVTRQTREEVILFVWTGLTIVLLGIVYEVWRA